MATATPSSTDAAKPITNPTTPVPAQAPVSLPRLTIAFCTQCRWNLRAAYYAQELLQTFGTALGEVALVPSTGGEFVVALTHLPAPQDEAAQDKAEETAKGEFGVQRSVLWDRKVDGGFPETKVLKGRVRDLVEPGRGLGHTDRALQKGTEKEKEKENQSQTKDADGDDGAGKASAAPVVGKDAEGNVEEVTAGGNPPQDCQDCR